MCMRDGQTDISTFARNLGGHVQCTRALSRPLGARVASNVHPTSVTVSLPVKEFAPSIAGSASPQKGTIPQPSLKIIDLPSIQYTHSRARRPRRHRRTEGRPHVAKGSAEWRAAAVARRRTRRRLFRVSCGRELTGTRALIDKKRASHIIHTTATRRGGALCEHWA